MPEGLSIQQQLVLEEQLRMLEAKDRTGEHLDGKAATVLQSGGLVIALTGAVSIPAFVSQQTPWVLVGIAFAFAMFLGMLLCAILAWRPSPYAVPGAKTWDELFSDYLYKSGTECYDQVLSNVFAAVRQNHAHNEHKALLVQWAGWLFAVQVAGILVLAVAGALLS